MPAITHLTRDRFVRHIIIMAKAPVPGLAKTRLAPLLGDKGAANAQRELITHALALIDDTISQGWADSAELCCTPDVRHPTFDEYRKHLNTQTTMTQQSTGDLGERMFAAFERTVKPSMRRVVMIGTDCPELNKLHMRDAFDSLEQSDAVFAPTEDGGYALIGLKELDPIWFAGMPWSTRNLMPQTRATAKSAGRSMTELETLYDIDTPADYARWKDSH
jgi:uncharacterized protein